MALQFGRFRIDRERLVLEHDGEPLTLAPKSVELLAALVERPGELVTKRDLLDHLWPETTVEEANLSQHVYVIRKTLEARDPAARAAIVTVPKRGYRFVAPPSAGVPGRGSDGFARVIEVAPAVSAPPVLAPEMPPVDCAAWPIAVASARSAGSSRGYAAARASLGWLRRYALVVAAAFVLVLVRGASGAGLASVEPALSIEGAGAVRLGRYNLDLRTHDGIARSRSYFARVIASDPRSPSGYAGLADAILISADYHVGTLPMTTSIRRAAALAQRAAAFGPGSAEAHTSLGLVANYRRDAPGAERELRRAIGLDPAYAPAHHWLGTVLFDAGDFAGSLHELLIATQLNPISTATSAWLELAAYFAHCYDTAIEHGTRAIELDPSRRDSLRELGLAYDAKGDYRAALATFARIRKTDALAPSVPYLLAAVYAHAGRPDIARRLLGRARPAPVVDAELPFALLALGQAAAAAAAVTRLHFEDCRDRRLYIADPRLDGVRRNAAFGRLVEGNCAERG